MDTNNWRPAPAGGGEPTMDTGDWRAQLQPDSRQRIVNKIMDTLKRHLPFSGQDGLQELKKIAVRFEEKIYTSATSQPDYLRKISLKMLTMESKSQNTMANSLSSNPGSNNKNPPDTGSLGMSSQITNQGPSLPIPMAANQGQARQQLLSQNLQNNISAVQGFASLTTTLPPGGGLPPTNMPNIVGQNSNLQTIQNISGVSQNSVGNPMGQGVSNNIFSHTQREMPGRQQEVAPQQQQQQSQNSQHYLYQQQLQQQQQQMMKQKYPQGSIPNAHMQSHLQPQQQQNLLQSNQLQSSQQSVMQPSPQLSGLQQSQQSSVQQQPVQPILQQNPQSVLRQQQPQQTQDPFIHQQQTQMQAQTLLPPQQQQQLMGQQPNSTIMQQQQQRLLSQQNSLYNLQHQHLMSQQNNLQNQHQQLGPQSNIAALQQRQQQQQQQQQLLVPQSDNSSMQTNQQSIQMLQQSKVPLQQQNQQGAETLLPTQGGQQSEPQPPQQQLLSQMQSQPAQLQQLAFQQHPNALQRDMQQRLQPSGPLIQSQNMMDQQKQQLLQQQRAIPEASSTSLDSTVQTGNANSRDWQEDVYQKITAMKDAYLPELTEMHQKIAGKLQQHDSFPQQPKNEQLEKLKIFKTMVERVMTFLQVPKSSILPGFKDKLGSYEKQIVHFLNSNRPRKPGASLQQGQPLLPPHVLSVQPSQQSQSQISQSQPHENPMNPQLQSLNFQGSVPMMQQSNVANLQHDSLSSLSGVTNTSPSMINSLQPSTNMDSGQGNALNNLQQVAVGSLQQNPVNAPQQVSINSLSSHGGMNVLQPNLTSLQSNSNMLQHQHLKQQEHQLLQIQLKQQFQQRHNMQQELMHKQQFLQQQQQQQLHQQTKHQQQNGQLQAHQMSQLRQMNEANDLKMKQQKGAKSGVFQETPSAGQLSAYHHQQLNSGAQFRISSPQLLQAASPQMRQHGSQIDQQNMVTSLTESGSPLQSASSPFVFPSPSTHLALTPVESEKVNSGDAALANAGNIGHQQIAGAGTLAQSLAIGTPMDMYQYPTPIPTSLIVQLILLGITIIMFLLCMGILAPADHHH